MEERRVGGGARSSRKRPTAQQKHPQAKATKDHRICAVGAMPKPILMPYNYKQSRTYIKFKRSATELSGEVRGDRGRVIEEYSAARW